MDLVNINMTVPSIKHHSLYVKFWKNIYKNVKEGKTYVQYKQLEKYKYHLAKVFDTLRHIKDDDFFEWNHAMIVYLVISLCDFKLKLQNETNIETTTGYQTWLKNNQMLKQKTQEKLSDIVLLIEHVDDRWGHFQSQDLTYIQHYVDQIYHSASKYVHNAGDLGMYDRWNLIDAINYKNLYRVRTVLIMQLACKQAYQTKNIMLGALINKFNISTNINVSDEEERQFIRWAENEKTFFSIRRFRTRITQVIWRFLDNLPSRWLHTYQRTGEEPTVYSHVSGKYPSAWINSINHNVLYSEPSVLMNSNNPLIHEATIFAFIEAYFRTLHQINWTSYCFCNEFDIIKNNTAIRSSKFPLIIRYWKKFAVVFGNKIYKTDTIVKSLLTWLKIIKTECNYLILENINLFNTFNTMIPAENIGSLNPEDNSTIKHVGNKKIFEISL
tara:strand:+ start:422 stop:1744 length:1323 start_codon:yes stop_codon:yes gene_type:complete